MNETMNAETFSNWRSFYLGVRIGALLVRECSDI